MAHPASSETTGPAVSRDWLGVPADALVAIFLLGLLIMGADLAAVEMRPA